MKIKFILFLLFSTISFILFSCKNGGNDSDIEIDKTDTPVQINIDSTKEYEEDIEVLFDEKVKTNLEDSLLRAIKICNPKETDLKNYKFPACVPKFFKIYPIISKVKTRDAFLVLCKSGVAGFPMRRILVYVKEGDEYVVTNTFLADLIGMESSTKSSYKDLILQFMDEDENRFECRYVWKEGRYSYNMTMKINRNKIKAQYLDSMKVVIANEIKRMKLSY